MKSFHIDRKGWGRWYAVRNHDGKESSYYPFRWTAWVAGWFL